MQLHSNNGADSNEKVVIRAEIGPLKRLGRPSFYRKSQELDSKCQFPE